MVLAFNPITVLDFSQAKDKDKVVKVESIEIWGDRLLVGGADGVLTIYEFTEEKAPAASSSSVPAGQPPPPPKYYPFLAETNKNFGAKKPILQLAAVEDAQILVSLCQDGAVTIHDLPLSTRTVGSPMPSLAVKASLGKTKGCEFFTIEQRKGWTMLCVAMKKKIALFNWDGAQFVENKDISIPENPRTIAWAGDQSLCVGTKREYCLVNTTTMVTSTIFPAGSKPGSVPYVMRMPDGLLLVNRDNLGNVLHPDARPAREFSLSWTEPPVSMSYSHPFVIGLLPRCVEVRWTGPARVSTDFYQPIQIRGAKCIAVRPLSDQIYVATPSSIVKLVPVPLDSVIEQLVAEQGFDMALALCDCLAVQMRETKRKQVKSAHAYFLFRKQGVYRKAMELFVELRTDITEVLSLYKGLFFPGSGEFLNGTARDKAMEALSFYLIQMRPLHCTPEALKTFAQVGIGSPDGYKDCKDAPVLLDTSLLHVSALRPEDRIIRELVSAPNCCYVSRCEEVLIASTKFAELVLLYQTKGLHLDALRILENKKLPLSDSKHIINYLRSLGNSQADLIWKYSVAPLKDDPDSALLIFTDPSRPPQEELPRAKVLEHLKANAATLVIPYLEYIISKGEKDSSFHDELVAYYKDMAVRFLSSSNPGVPCSVGKEPGVLGKTRESLLKFLKTSKYYTPELLTGGRKGSFPEDALFEEHVVILGRLARHKQALEICVYKMRDLRAAEEYCQEHYCEEKVDSKDVYITLIEVLLKQEGGKPPALVEQALDILNRHHPRMDIVRALDLFPVTVPIAKLTPFFEKVLQEMSRKRRELQVVRSLLKSEQLQVWEQLIAERSLLVKVDEDFMCSSCRKPLRNSAFVRFPADGSVVHLMCYQNSSPASSFGSAPRGPFIYK